MPPNDFSLFSGDSGYERTLRPPLKIKDQLTPVPLAIVEVTALSRGQGSGGCQRLHPLCR